MRESIHRSTVYNSEEVEATECPLIGECINKILHIELVNERQLHTEPGQI